MSYSALHRSRSLVRRAAVVPLSALVAVSVLAACGSGDSGGATPPKNHISAGTVPDYYPSDYQKIIDASKKEGGDLVIYSNTDEENWAPIFRDFKKKYSWVTSISANNLDSDEVFQRELSELATGNAPADMLVSNAAQAWAQYAEDPSHLLSYQSPELAKLPKFATVMPNVYAMSEDPIVIAYNSSLMDKAPTSLADLASQVSADPAKFKDKITARDVGGAFGFTVAYNLTEARPDAWNSLAKILPEARPETSSGTQIEKILSGEYLAGLNISAAPTYPQVADSNGLLAVNFAKDGTVVLPRGIGIAPKAPHPATAKLFLDFVLSAEGQAAVAEGGLTSYRDSVKAAEGLHTYQELVGKVGESNVILVKYELIPQAKVDAFTKRWNGLFKG